MGETPIKLRNHLTEAKRVVVKVGTRLLVSSSGKPSEARMRALVHEIARLRRNGREVILVTSGAIGSGMEVLGLKTRPKTVPDLQMAAAVGQTRLMSQYEKCFARERVHVGQVLLTHDDLNNRTRHLNARNTMLNLLRHGILPIVNENDAVATEEITIGDNDVLAALVALLCGADVLVLLTSVNGVLKPVEKGGTRRIPWIESVTDEILSFAQGKGSDLSVGGMNSKLQAAQMVARAGGLVVIADGRKSNTLSRVFSAADSGTLVGRAKPDKSGLQRHRKQWLAFFHRAQGSVVIDDGACQAIERRGRSLLPIGVIEVRGVFDTGSLINVLSRDGRVIARGLVEYSSAQMQLIKGRPTAEIASVLGEKRNDEAIHRDNMVVLSGTGELPTERGAHANRR